MGDYAMTKIILKVKPEYQDSLKTFIEFEKCLDDLNLPWKEHEAHYTDFWESIGISSFYYESYVFSSGSFHAYTTSLGRSSEHEGSDFYVDDKYTTRFSDGLWFVEFSSKVGQHSHFTDVVVPKIADAWLGLYGDEYRTYPERLNFNEELIVSSIPETQIIIDSFREEYNYKEDEDDDWRGPYGYR